MIVVLLIGVAFGFYHNSRIEDAVSTAVDLGIEQQKIIEEYFDIYGQMPQSQADISLSPFIAKGILTGMDYQAGELGIPASNKLRVGTLRALVDMIDAKSSESPCNDHAKPYRDTAGLAQRSREAWR